MKVMGILNATPDSFFDESRVEAEEGILRGLELENLGAEILDIGGESTRPGAEPVVAEEEIRRVVPLIRGLVDSGCRATISIDTRKYETAKAAFQAGALWLNDVSALEDDPRLGPFAAETGMTVVLMHRQGTSATMQNSPTYWDVVAEVRDHLASRIEFALSCGIVAEKIFLDPGIGFGKTLENNLDLMRNLPKLKSLGFPLLVGLSRKSFIGKLTGAEVHDRLPGSLAAALAAHALGAEVIRVHDVRETVQALKVWESLFPGSAA